MVRLHKYDKNKGIIAMVMDDVSMECAYSIMEMIISGMVR